MITKIKLDYVCSELILFVEVCTGQIISCLGVYLHVNHWIIWNRQTYYDAKNAELLKKFWTCWEQSRAPSRINSKVCVHSSKNVCYPIFFYGKCYLWETRYFGFYCEEHDFVVLNVCVGWSKVLKPILYLCIYGGIRCE